MLVRVVKDETKAENDVTLSKSKSGLPSDFYKKNLTLFSAEELNTSCFVLNYTPRDGALTSIKPDAYIGIVFPSPFTQVVGVVNLRMLLNGMRILPFTGSVSCKVDSAAWIGNKVSIGIAKFDTSLR